MQAVGNGKVILLGEHTVVHGTHALAMGLTRGCLATAAPADQDRIQLAPLGADVTLGAEVETDHERTLQLALATAYEDAPQDRPKFSIEAELQVPAGAGLGASAAISVAVARAIDHALGRTRTPEQLIEASLRWERVYHGNPSGVDSTMAVMGGVALYRKGEPLRPVALKAFPHVVVAYSGSAPSTKLMVESVGRQYAQEPERVGKVFEAVESIVQNGRAALEEGDFKALGQLMQMNQKLLNGLMLSTPTIEAMCTAATEAGALGAKLTGGGGGGCMIALGADKAGAEKVRQALSEFDGQAFVVEEQQ